MNKKIAIFHDYLNQYGGAERVLEKLLEIFPEAHVYTFVYDAEVLPQFKKHKVVTSPVQYLPYAKQRYQWYVWLFPIVIKLFNFSRYDVVIVSTHAWGNGIRKAGARMITYCHTPMRYIWDLYGEYMKNRYISWWIRCVMPFVRPILQQHDKRCAKNADVFIANSKEVKQRIHTCYNIEAEVIYPPVNVDFFSDATIDAKDDYYLVVTRLKPYKRVDLIIEVFNRLQKKLIIVGSGPEEAKLRRMAGDTISFHSDVTDEELRELYQRAQGYVYMANEDFGMSMVEAQAAGTPVIAYRKGGACEIVIDGETGVFVEEQTAKALREALHHAEVTTFERRRMCDHAQQFSQEYFQNCIQKVVG
ncbi:glycosyltransferase [Candidatus Omnitrophota bacterium]